MKKMMILIAASMLILLSACGSKQESGTEKTGKAENTEMGLVKEGNLTFSMTGIYPPLNFKKDGKLTGFDVEIGTEIAKRMGLEANPVTNPWETIIQGLKAKKYDAIIGSMTATPERDKQVDFTEPYYLSGAQIFVAEGSTIQSKDDLKGKTIGVIQASTWKDLADELSDKVKGYPVDTNALQDLELGRLDAVITDKIVGLNAQKEKGLKIKPVGELLNEDRVSVAVNEGNTELKEKINEAIQSMVDDGTYEEISMKWFNRNILEK
ncbi:MULTISPECIES: ABC transporter substrate-binding protein [Bacillaceae]|uniref:Polar amino acid transport system substrate-binding protein n=1 Tax=Peribacillus huizhouensis TaxID=1501239 RepID=A0ABR6CTP4_9BACI|nr:MULTISPECIES: ABC transporter substrate-binding protein [Bacillaceae]MBA9028414.1 polar amino acid transport system substrate-binding protein [Peribacillus huizhouensis]